jgi:DNA polymerase III subunit alpha
VENPIILFFLFALHLRNMKFSHLHAHTQYSLLDGAASIKGLYAKAIKDGQPAVAITDHGNMFGVFEFVKEAHKHKNADGSLKVKPIVGCEFYITKDRHKKTFSKDDRDPRHHQILLAKNEIGYKNLVKLTSLGYIEGMYSKYPRIDKELINKYHEGLIATTCCLGALVPQTILTKGEEEGENEFKWWLNIFQEDYYVELQRHGIPDQEKVNAVLLKFAEKHKVKVIASNDSHYVDIDDFNAHDILLCVNTGEKLATPANREFSDDDVITKNTRFGFPNDQFYFKTTDEMSKLFKDLPQAIDNTNEIVDKIDILKLEKEILLPHFVIPANFKTQDEYLTSITWAGAKERYKIFTPEVEERISFELGVIKDMGFAGYFLIVSDFIRAGKEMDVFIGPGRGSAAGSVVAYCIGITNIDPIKYKLLFERFLNPERKSMPDIDTDFDDEGRQKVINYVVEKYGKSQVAQIITYGTMAAKSSIKDVARVLDLPLSESNALAKMVPDRPGTKLKNVLKMPLTIAEAKGEKSFEDEQVTAEELEGIKKLREIYNDAKDPRSAVLKDAEKLEGSVRNTGIHAAGIIIAPTDLTELIPVATSKESDLWITQIEGNSIEEAGVIKMDFLGLKTLSILKTAIALIKINHGVVINLDTLELDDEKTYQLYQRGDTNGTFQFESPGMQKYLRELRPDKFDDLIAMNALYRPGPLAYIPDFIQRKHGIKKVEYDIPEMEEYLGDTYGITVYQEQVMLLSQKLAGFSKGDADVLRKAMGKKQIETLAKMKSKFIDGAVAKGHNPEKLTKIWTDWEAFAQYAFNKSHSTCYAYVAYHTAYLKAHYPSEYMAAVLNHAGSIDKITFFMEECKRMGLNVLGPDINESAAGFAVNKKGQIRFGFSGLKGVGEKAIEDIVEERTKNGAFKSVFDLVKRVNQRTVNKKTFESLVYAGAFDCFDEYNRATYLHQISGDISNTEKIIKFGSIAQTSTTANTNTLFGDMAMPEIQPPKLLTRPDWHTIEKLTYEKEITGIYISGHPLDDHKFELTHLGFTEIAEFVLYNNEIANIKTNFRKFRLAGLVTDPQHRLTKNGKDYGVLTFEDLTSSTSLYLFGEDYQRFKQYFEKGTKIMLEGTFQKQQWSEKIEFKINKMMLLETALATLPKVLNIKLSPFDITEGFTQFFNSYTTSNPGKTVVNFIVTDEKTNQTLRLQSANGKGITITDDLTYFFYTHDDIELKINTI